MSRRMRKTNGQETIPQAPEVSEEVEAPEVAVTFPVGKIPEGVYVTYHIDVQLDMVQRKAMRRLVEGFRDRPQQMANGRFIQNGADVVRYLCEQVSEAVE